ncbi:hypothetical protein LTR56_006762 [Elasticomyces elasticus]|nr:hypothetical protein LTR22_015478 [Elasticomyces elasticus]KAK3649579.1 hypothetical protein LTR56_006762 [Elasticomyces elasticus]KAK4915091.1 hypothetical protein LTR49_016719 [Elasticomyces elasticus]KAK5754549.1 hypothetical protein LTS12_015386 [Elasticomyces elasticus]
MLDAGLRISPYPPAYSPAPAQNNISSNMSGLRFAAILALALSTSAEHHMTRHRLPIRQSGNTNTPILISNWCSETIYPAILSQGGTGPSNTGYTAKPGTNQTVYVSSDWQGRVWARSNCTFGGNGAACTTGDCGGMQACKGPGAPPATLAEFTLHGSDHQAFYDISLVDGYNFGMAIVLLPGGNPKLQALDPSTTNPSCVASVNGYHSQASSYNPYNNNQQFLGTSSKFPLPFDQKQTSQSVSSWCPWDLQTQPPLAPGNGVYPYPDANIQRPAYDPCISACSKYGDAAYCCTGKYNGPNSCTPSYYSKAAKSVCPDAYSFAYDDQDSTFITPTGSGFQVVFCPGGRSTNIIGSKGSGSIRHT